MIKQYFQVKPLCGARTAEMSNLSFHPYGEFTLVTGLADQTVAL